MEISRAILIRHEITNDVITMQATIDGVEMSVPLDPANRHYAAIMEMVDAGILTIAEADNG